MFCTILWGKLLYILVATGYVELSGQELSCKAGFCHTPALLLRLGVDSVSPLSQEQIQQEHHLKKTEGGVFKVWT